jgi:prepilin-type N-terminal cleavage/methylation domain-containing protein
MQIGYRTKAGFTLVEIMIVVAIIGLLAAIAIPNFVRARTTSQTNACINNLRQIDGAKQQWALEFGAATNSRPGIAELQPYLGRGVGGSLPTCPMDAQDTFSTSYRVGNVSIVPVCRIDPTDHTLPNGAVVLGVGGPSFGRAGAPDLAP